MEGKTPEGFTIVSSWNGLTKNKEGEAELHLLHKYEPEPVRADMSDFLSQASPVIINNPETRHRRSKERVVVPLNDIHFGFRRENGELVPTHDPEALDKVLQICQELQPNEIVINGDGIDLPELSSFSPDSKAMVETTQASLDGCHTFLAYLRAVCPNSKISYLEGNHEIRSSKTLLKNAMPLFGIRQANMPESFAVSSIPFLLRLDELEIDYISGYPANAYDFNDRLKIIHGEFATQNTAQKYLGMYACSVCFGHTHREELASHTYPNGYKKIAFNPGALCKTDGIMPSVHSGVDVNGRHVERHEQWQKGVSILYGKEGDSPFAFDIIDLDNEKVRYNNRVYTARQDIMAIYDKIK